MHGNMHVCKLDCKKDCRLLVNLLLLLFQLAKKAKEKTSSLSNFTTIFCWKKIVVLLFFFFSTSQNLIFTGTNAPGSVEALTEISHFSHLLVSVFYNSLLCCFSAGVFSSIKKMYYLSCGALFTKCEL